MRKLNSTLFYSLFYAFIATLLLTSCSKDSADFSFKGEFTYQEQKTIGTILRDELLNNPKHYNIIDDEDNTCGYEYTSKIVEMLVERDMIRNTQNFDWKVYLINDYDQKIAFTLPGGYIFLSTGLVKYLDTENQLVAVIAHEMAYADKGFAMDKLVENYGSTALVEILNKVSNPSIEPLKMAASVANFYYSKAIVREADTYSAAMVCPYSYAADGIVKVLEKTIVSRNRVEWLETKPSYPQRVEFLESYTKKSCCHGEETFEERFNEIKNTCFNQGG